MARKLHIEKREGRGDNGTLIYEDDFTIPDAGDYPEWEKIFGGLPAFDDQLKSSYAIKTRASNDPRRKQTQVDKLNKMAIAEGFESWDDMKIKCREYHLAKTGVIDPINDDPEQKKLDMES